MTRLCWTRAVLAAATAVLGCRPQVLPVAEPNPPVVAPVDRSIEADADTVVGVVRGPDGMPVRDAVVAINGVDSGAAAIVGVDADGRFVAERPAERFAITVTSPQGRAVFVPPAEAAAVETLRLTLGPNDDGLTIRGTLSVRAGAMPPDTHVLAARNSTDEGDLFKTRVSASGDFELLLPPGRYSLRPDSERFVAGWVVTEGETGAARSASLEASLRAPAPDGAVQWLGERALRIATTDVDEPTDDVAALAEVLAKARVIGMGEATHGTREFFRLKHRVLQRLVTHHGLTLLAMEANFSDAERIDAWVRGGKGTVEDAMTGLFVVWRTEEIRDLLLWLRAFNADPAHTKKVGFRGYDVQGAGASIAALRTYFGKVDRSKQLALLDPLAPLESKTVDLSEAETETTREAIALISQQLSSARRRYVARSSKGEHALMVQHARVLEQARVRFAAQGNAAKFEARDQAMADNVVWLSEQLAPEDRMMVWAHNGHVQLDASTLLGKNMGMQLRSRLGADYIAAGFVLDEGEYRAWVKPNEPTLADVAVGPHEDGWAAEAFARVGAPVFAVDLRTAPEGAARDWLFSPRIVHSCGWLVSKWETAGTVDVFGRLFDVAIYVQHTTSARQIRRPR